MKEGNSSVSEDSRTRSNGLELRKQEHRVGSREQFFTLASAVPDETTAGRRNCSPSPGSRAHCPHTCTAMHPRLLQSATAPQPVQLQAVHWHGHRHTCWGSHCLHGPTALLKPRSDSTLKPSINLAPLSWAEEGHGVSPWLYFTTLGCFWSYSTVTKVGFAYSVKGEQSPNHKY